MNIMTSSNEIMYAMAKSDYLKLKQISHDDALDVMSDKILIGGSKIKKSTKLTNSKSKFSKIDFDAVKTTKILGIGMFGTTYLAQLGNKKYALKIQHILPKDRIKDFKNELWRELDLYEYINGMKKDDQSFFTRLHGFEIFNNCKHIQMRPFKVDFNDPKNKFAKKIKELDESDWCVKYLLDLQGNMQLGKFLLKSRIPLKLLYSICLQICKITDLLYEGGYSHNDLHPGNIMINKTDKKYFTLKGKRIPFEGYQISTIDYGMVQHEKYDIKDRFGQKFRSDESSLFTETFYAVINTISGLTKHIEECDNRNKIIPWERKEDTATILIQKLQKNYSEFFGETLDRYIKLFPLSAKPVAKAIKSLQSIESVSKILKGKEYEHFWNVMDRVILEFDAIYPAEYARYYKWCTTVKILVPIDAMKGIESNYN